MTDSVVKHTLDHEPFDDSVDHALFVPHRQTRPLELAYKQWRG